MTASRLKSPRRKRLFWTLHSLGWFVYGCAQCLGALLYRESRGYLAVIGIAAVSGFVLSTPLRYLYRRLADAGPRVMLIGALASCYLLSLPYRAVVNNAYRLFVEPTWVFTSVYEAFSGALSSTALLLCWSGLYFGTRYYETLQQQREAALRADTLAREAQLRMLRYQLNPHFLFNTLNAISTLILDRKNSIAAQTVTRLSSFLRYSLDQDPMKKVTLRQELHALDLYLQTERLRFGTRLQVDFDIDAKVMEALIPSLLLQPLVENSLKHAIMPSERGGRIQISARAADDLLSLTVGDDGPGMPDPVEDSAARPGVGLSNTRERLSVLYGSVAGLIASNLTNGLEVRLHLPLEYVGGPRGAH